jgi:hypothetical protein
LDNKKAAIDPSDTEIYSVVQGDIKMQPTGSALKKNIFETFSSEKL